MIIKNHVMIFQAAYAAVHCDTCYIEDYTGFQAAYAAVHAQVYSL